ncbi:MAG: indolepyruvate ferredoxin oxidoreductase subunit alpha [Rhodospirillaceae bacterium]|nr:indolepyruvate ferredoxin oxidoreductase subunit alpha [Rhodospirillaceae bacterium]MBT5194348.1 indolepyruvate ferredoxin oxidoreductase subunit alpha [Rhodospirillaceae bacterium]MBT5897105.1 indolepyruvate ferredoxin oxidoreductase subunit alpha [Rhodospirillaceae bacterium]MBT6427596.1 indolepyruvate ferredoxin oxidoreductase subunit alpha [Rhodospirillaceae bacterium]MBT7760721.1 indolepyruvate ferredoxin oxidoreductase subunit alpha [Rhodospirillaceae bacterium]
MEAVRPDDRSEDQARTQAHPLTGNEAIARGAWEAGVKVASAYPGTPSTEILESLATYDADEVNAEWSTNEKVAVDVAIGASFQGVRALAAMKHVGLNVAADPVMSQTYVGVNGGLVLAVCDDPGIHSSQNEQDTRLFCRLANIPVLEPSDAQEALDFTRLAFDISEEFDTPVILRATTRLSHTRSPVFTGPRITPEDKPFIDDPNKNVVLPAVARVRHPFVVEREARLQRYFEASPLTRWEKGDTTYGIITNGTSYPYVKEVVPGVSVLKLASSYPLARETVQAFCDSVEKVLVVEELEPFIETEVKAMGIKAEGKVFFPRCGEFSPEVIRAGLAKAGLMAAAEESHEWNIKPILRPPVLCAGCPHTGGYMALRALDARVTGDIGCYTLAAVEPLRAIDTNVCMGASIGNAVGMAKAGTETKPIVATIGDSTFLHSGIPPLIDAVYSDVDITVLILDNKITAMTGGQHHPGTGKNLRGQDAHQVDFEDICRSVGVTWVRVVDSYDLGALYRTMREAAANKGVSVVISNRPCVLDPVKIKGPALRVAAKDCVACQACMNLGCPAITWSDEMYDGHHKVKIDEVACMGCTLCAQVCPSDCVQPVSP